MRRAAAYLRVSSEKQADEDRFGYHRQIGDIQTYAARSELEMVAEYRDAITGKSVSRKGLDTLIAEAHGFDVVVISSVDRLARDVGASYQVLANLLASELQVHSADQGLIDLDQETSLIQFNLQALFAHLERQKIVKRTRSAVNAIAKAGQIPDGLRTFGYRVHKRVAEIVPEEAAVIVDIYERSAAGQSLVGIAQHLTDTGVPRRMGGSTPWRFTDVRQIIRRRTYKGEYHWSTYVIPVPAIVSPELWQRAQPRGRGRPWGVSTLQLLKHIRCGLCGHVMSTRKNAKSRNPSWSYKCVGNTYHTVMCKQPAVSGRYLDPIAEREVRAALSDPVRVKAMLDAAQVQTDDFTEQRQALEAEDARWLEAYRVGAITAAEMGKYRADVKRRLRALGGSKPTTGRSVREYAAAAKTMPLRDLLDFANVEIVVWARDNIEIRVHGNGA